jgi:predicted Zn-dependent protease
LRWLADKYLEGSSQKIAEADSALRKALELNPDLPLAHNFYTHIQVDQGRALEAMQRLLQRARSTSNDPELFAGLTHACRYCGLLGASVAAHRQARRLDPNIPTTVMHTYFMLGDYQNALDESKEDFGYGIASCLGMLGRVDEAIAVLKKRATPQAWQMRLGRLFMVSLRALFEGDRAESLRASDELINATFRDPEGWFHLARQLGYLGENQRAFVALSRAVDGGFRCYPALAADPWLDPLRGDPEFKNILRKIGALHHEALNAFEAGGGKALLGVFVQ